MFMLDKVIIRKANNTDFDQLSKLFHEFNFDFNISVTNGQAKELLKVEDEKFFTKSCTEWILSSLICFVAEQGNTLLGYISGNVKINEGETYSPEGIIDTWFVTASQRGNGVGKLLYQALLEYFSDQKCKVLTLEAYYQNSNTISTYERMGFVKDSLVLKKIV